MVVHMTTSGTLPEVIAPLLGIDAADVQPELAFAGTCLQGSLMRTRLYTAIEQQLGVACQAAYTARTYGELHTAVYGKAPDGYAAPVPSSPPHPVPPPQPNATTPGVACGIDIEMIAHLPVATDYWRHAFYSASFTPAEIAYCLLQEEPLMHFAARWCAKEALKKCAPTYLDADLHTLEVTVQASGAPGLCAVVDGHSTPLPFAVSLSHTPQMAVAVVLQLPASPVAVPAAPPAVVPVVPPPVAVAADAGGQRRTWLPVLLSSAALALALWALVRTW